MLSTLWNHQHCYVIGTRKTIEIVLKDLKWNLFSVLPLFLAFPASPCPHPLPNPPSPQFIMLTSASSPRNSLLPSPYLFSPQSYQVRSPFFPFLRPFCLGSDPCLLPFFFFVITHKWLLVLPCFLITPHDLAFYWTYLGYWNRYSCLIARLVCCLGMQPPQLHSSSWWAGACAFCAFCKLSTEDGQERVICGVDRGRCKG